MVVRGIFMISRVLPGRLASIHYQNVTGDVVGSIRSEKDSGSLKVMFIAKPAQRNLGKEKFTVVLQHLVRHVGGKPAGSNRIPLDVVHPPFARQIFGEADHSALAGMIANGWECGWSTTQSSHRGYIDDLSAALLDHDLSHGLCTKKG